jgi:hypothetical protein
MCSLDYEGLKKRLNGMPSRRPNANGTAFVELVTPPRLDDFRVARKYLTKLYLNDF